MAVDQRWGQVLDFLEWGGDDTAALAAIDWQAVAREVVPRFYAKLRRDPELNRLVGGEAVYQRLSRMLHRYLLALAEEPDGRDYHRRMRQIAEAHVRIGVDPDWYLGAYRLIWVAVERVCRAAGNGDEAAPRCFAAASKRLMADMMRVMAYYHRLSAHKAEVDALTGVATRWGQAAWMARQGGQAVAGVVVVADLDDFKWLNDTFGHYVGDQILQEFARRLQVACAPADLVVRSGGDEFVLWRPEGMEAAADWVSRLHRLVTATGYETSVGALRLGVSIGYAVGPLTDVTAREADACLLRAKRRGKNQICGPGTGLAEDAGRGTPTAVPAGPDGELGWLAEAAAAVWEDWPTAAVLVNRRGSIIACNRAYEALVGRPRGQLLGQNPRINQSGRTPARVYQGLWQALQQGRSWRGLLENRRPSGERWWAEEEMVPVRLGQQVVGYWASVREVATAPRWPRPHASVLEGTAVAVAFQPIVALADHRLIGFEALARPRRGSYSLSPLTYFALARFTLDEARADRAALTAVRRALRRYGNWPAGAHLFVNLRPATLANPAALRRVIGRLTEVVPPDRLVLEIGEQAADQGFDWGRLRQRYPELKWAQDDMGAGEADLIRLVATRPDWIKIDQRLTGRLGDDDARDLVAAITQWAHRRQIRVIVEGVETAEQAQTARDLGVDGGQGFWLGRPRLAAGEDGPAWQGWAEDGSADGVREA